MTAPNQMTDEKFSRWLGKVLLDKCCRNCTHCLQKPLGCFSCLSNTSVKNPEGWITRPKEHCCLDFNPDPIPLTPAEAFKWRDWAVKEYTRKVYSDKLTDIVIPNINSQFGEVLIALSCDVQPRDHLQAAAELKENKK